MGKKKHTYRDRLEGSWTIKVSEHAILRYLERVEGLDVNRVLDAMFPTQTIRAWVAYLES